MMPGHVADDSSVRIRPREPRVGARTLPASAPRCARTHVWGTCSVSRDPAAASRAGASQQRRMAARMDPLAAGARGVASPQPVYVSAQLGNAVLSGVDGPR
jgi:hypothetical protein